MADNSYRILHLALLPFIFMFLQHVPSTLAQPPPSTCLCPNFTPEQILQTGKNVALVRVLTASTTRLPNSSVRHARFRVRVELLAKGCLPIEFDAESFLRAGVCGVRLRVGDRVRVILPDNTGDSSDARLFVGCFRASPWRNVAKAERQLLLQTARQGGNVTCQRMLSGWQNRMTRTGD